MAERHPRQPFGRPRQGCRRPPGLRDRQHRHGRIATGALFDMPGLLAQADQALYCAKERGRNRVEVASLELVLGPRCRRPVDGDRGDLCRGNRRPKARHPDFHLLRHTLGFCPAGICVFAGRTHRLAVMKRSDDRILTTHVGSLIRPERCRISCARSSPASPMTRRRYARA